MKQEQKYAEAATLLGYLSVYFDRERGSPVDAGGLSVATLLEQIELWGLAGRDSERLEALQNLEWLAEALGEIGLLQMVQSELG